MDYLLLLTLLIAAQTTFLVVTQFYKVRNHTKKYVFVDTSVLIDGRIIAVAEAGFLPGTLAIPRSVVGELQLLADTGDTDKRTRARHGLDVVKLLQEMPKVKTVIFPDSTRANEGVDNRLLSLAKKHKGSLCTIDYNLNKVAQVEDIVVLNVNDLAKSLRMAYLPGEKTIIELTQKGNDSHQAVGHLSDGTMVVVENASQLVGKAVEVEFIRSLQTSAGKMMFARPTQPAPSKEKRAAKQIVPKPPRRSQTQPQQPVKQSPTPARSTNRRPQSNRRRNNPEDNLVELANR